MPGDSLLQRASCSHVLLYEGDLALVGQGPMSMIGLDQVPRA